MQKKSQSISIKGHNSAENLQKITGSDHNLDLVNINVYTETSLNSVHFNRNEICTSIKGQNSVTSLRKMTGNNLNLDLVNINA